MFLFFFIIIQFILLEDGMKVFLEEVLYT